MSTTMEDILYEEMLDSLYSEEIMKNAAATQCIYIFVEGDSEEAVFQMLLEACGLNFEAHGIVIANYNGIGNLKHAIRLLKKTLSHDRPIIVTYDDDPPGKKAVQHVDDHLVTVFKIPQVPIVRFSNGSYGGSLEEVFSSDLFIESAFNSDVILNATPKMRAEFAKVFDAGKPWFAQLADFLSRLSINPNSINKIRLVEHMAVSCHPIPETFRLLAEEALSLRKKYPVKNPNDVDLPF